MLRNNQQAGARLFAIARAQKLPISLSGGYLVVRQGSQSVRSPFYVSQPSGGTRTAYFR
jgi:hypothetical protein